MKGDRKKPEGEKPKGKKRVLTEEEEERQKEIKMARDQLRPMDTASDRFFHGYEPAAYDFANRLMTALDGEISPKTLENAIFRWWMRSNIQKYIWSEDPEGWKEPIYAIKECLLRKRGTFKDKFLNDLATKVVETAHEIGALDALKKAWTPSEEEEIPDNFLYKIVTSWTPPQKK